MRVGVRVGVRVRVRVRATATARGRVGECTVYHEEQHHEPDCRPERWIISSKASRRLLSTQPPKTPSALGKWSTVASAWAASDESAWA